MSRIDLGLRVFPAHAEEIARAVKQDAERKGINPSRNDFCVLAVLAAARKVLADG